LRRDTAEMLHSNKSLTELKAGERYTLIDSCRVDGRVASAWLSPELDDSAWDDFLQTTPLGHYQQSSLWARAKSIEGWRPVRGILKLDGQMAGGFQILARNTRLGRIGYLSKGPVIMSEDPRLIDFLLELVVSTAKTNGLKGLIVQPPDQSTIDGVILRRHRFLPNHLVSVIHSTLMVDFSVGLDVIKRRMRKSTLAEIRRALRRGVKVYQGGEKDVSMFFRLMVTTCERQQTKPSPAAEATLLEVWRVLNNRGCAQLFMAECEGEPLAGMFCLCFGDRVTGWKKGWSGQHHDRYPNQLVLLEAIEWSHRQGYKFFDFAALSLDIASTLLRGESLSENQKKSRDFVHLSYGNLPMLLPKSQIYISNPVFRFAYRILGASTWFRALGKRLLN
jgi:hypothetical protein